MSVEYCHEHHHYYDTDWVEKCEHCMNAEDLECKHCGVEDTSYKGYCSRACYRYDLEQLRRNSSED